MVKLINPIKLLITVTLLSLIYTLNVEASEPPKVESKTAKQVEKTNLTKAQRAQINGTIEFKNAKELVNAFISPKEHIIDPLMKTIEIKNNIKITNKKMLGKISQKTIKVLLQSSDHLIKISTGSIITSAKLDVKSGSNTFSAWSDWNKRKPQASTIRVTVYYSNALPTVAFYNGNQSKIVPPVKSE
ncbi:MAG: hypothetical protein GY714_05025 [Desulfobacterales bacterium]|nr:hypothetical protein [Desulfobacterales bacterium]MCP4160295.1 hypothetical protein [Deltaproteobacteria bacterium]